MGIDYIVSGSLPSCVVVVVMCCTVLHRVELCCNVLQCVVTSSCSPSGCGVSQCVAGSVAVAVCLVVLCCVL